jgi:COX assembly mitochondrial protein 1
VRELYYKRVRQKCADEVREFATCCTNRTFTATLFCRPQQKAMNNCMMRFATQEEQDEARKEWFETFEERRFERERKEEKRKKDEVFWREWWDKEKDTKKLAENSKAK